MHFQSATLLAFSLGALIDLAISKHHDGFGNIGFYTDNTCTTLEDGTKPIDVKFDHCVSLTGLNATDNIGINWGSWDGVTGDGLEGLAGYLDDSCKQAAAKATLRPDAYSMDAQGAGSCIQPKLANGQVWLSVKQWAPCRTPGYC